MELTPAHSKLVGAAPADPMHRWGRGSPRMQRDRSVGGPVQPALLPSHLLGDLAVCSVSAGPPVPLVGPGPAESAREGVGFQAE